MWANTPPNDVGSDSKQRHKYILDIAIAITLLLHFPQQQQLFYRYKKNANQIVRRGGHKSRRGGASQGMAGMGVFL